LVDAILKGNKKDKTDIHSVNQYALGNVCRSRDDAKTYIYAFLLGAGDAKLANVLGCTLAEAKAARVNFLEFYPGLKSLKQEQIPYDASRGYFEGFDKRLVLCDSEHLMLAGYLQNGEAVIMKKAMQIWHKEFIRQGFDFKMVNWVHDEYVTETAEPYEVAAEMAKIQADALAKAGEIYNLYCPLSGAYLKEVNGEMVPSLGRTWYDVH
jgi:DNA polymerase I-like protein with 3'-5' exonuclease and polymerase domains